MSNDRLGGRPVYWTASRADELERLYRDGLDRDQLARHFGRTRCAISCALSTFGIKGRSRKVKASTRPVLPDHMALIPQVVALAANRPPGFSKERAVARAVSTVYGVDRETLHRRDRQRHLYEPRMVGMAIALRGSRPALVGRAFNRHHTTVVAAARKFDALVDTALAEAPHAV